MAAPARVTFREAGVEPTLVLDVVVIDYDYNNGLTVWSAADDWKQNWPNLQGTRRLINASEWGYSHLGYMKWWFDHLPRRAGTGAMGRQNNWWKYVFDFNGYPETR